MGNGYIPMDVLLEKEWESYSIEMLKDMIGYLRTDLHYCERPQTRRILEHRIKVCEGLIKKKAEMGL